MSRNKLIALIVTVVLAVVAAVTGIPVKDLTGGAPDASPAASGE